MHDVLAMKAFLSIAIAATALAACTREPTVATSGPTNVAGVPPSCVSGPYVQAGAELSASLEDDVPPDVTKPEPIAATLETDLRSQDGEVVVPAGSTLHGRVLRSERTPRPFAVVSFDAIDTPRGQAPLAASVLAVREEIRLGGRLESRILVGPRATQAPSGVTSGTVRPPIDEPVLMAGARMSLRLTRPILAPGSTIVERAQCIGSGP